MAVLTTKQRKKLPKKDFALPARKGAKDKFGKKGNKAGEGAFPENNKAHDIKAIQLAPYSYKKGNITKAQEKSIIRKAQGKLGLKKTGLTAKAMKAKAKKKGKK